MNERLRKLRGNIRWFLKTSFGRKSVIKGLTFEKGDITVSKKKNGLLIKGNTILPGATLRILSESKEPLKPYSGLKEKLDEYTPV